MTNKWILWLLIASLPLSIISFVVIGNSTDSHIGTPVGLTVDYDNVKNTSPFPKIPRSEWVLDWIEQPNIQSDKLMHFSYAVYASQASKDDEELPFLLNSHKAMIRETHQRKKTDIDGNFLHISGARVAPVDVETFLKNDNRAVKYVKGNLDEWETGNGIKVVPFVFNSYWGFPEALDPQWQRETYIVPQAQQVQDLLNSYLASVEVRKLSGDRRGTTLDLQIGAGADDGYTSGQPSIDSGSGEVRLGARSFGSHDGWFRFTGITGLSGVTIDVAYVSYKAFSADLGLPLTKIFANDVESPVIPTGRTDHDGKARTTAGTDWDNLDLSTSAFKNSPSIVDVIQELADSFDPSEIQILHDDDGSSQGSNNIARAETYDNDTADAAKLHIEFTVGAAAEEVSNSQVQLIGI